MNRRKFLGLGICASVAGVALKNKTYAQAAPAAGPVGETEDLAKSLGFHKNAAKVDDKKWPRHAGPEGKKMSCENCQLYAAEPTQKGMGKCTLFQMRLVPAKGWCNGWVKKA